MDLFKPLIKTARAVPFNNPRQKAALQEEMLLTNIETHKKKTKNHCLLISCINQLNLQFSEIVFFF